MELARPVALRGEQRTARFRLVQVSREVFLCQHLTRPLVWRREWQSHANAATELCAVDFASDAPVAGAPRAIRWNVPAALYLKGLKSAAELHGVKLAPG